MNLNKIKIGIPKSKIRVISEKVCNLKYKDPTDFSKYIFRKIKSNI